MNRLITLVGSTLVTSVVGWSVPVAAQPDGARLARGEQVRYVARISAAGFIEGQVTDDRGSPLAGVTVSATGSTTALTVTDTKGLYALRSLPAGGYLVRAQLAGFVPSRRQYLQVTPSVGTRYSVSLQRTGRKGDAMPGVLAAGLVPGSATPPEEPDPGEDRSETAWRLRHLKRSVLKDATERVTLGDVQFDDGQPATLAVLSRATGSNARLLADFPLNGEVNFLTSGSFDGTVPLYPGYSPLRNVGYLSIGGPALWKGDWAAQVMTQGDLGSWFVATAYRRRAPAEHLFNVGFSYSTQRFSSVRRWPLAKGSDGARTAGSLHVSDEWTVSPRVVLALGTGYARYDYLPDNNLFSPRLRLTVFPMLGMRVHGSVSRRVLAPGAEEFLEPLTAGLWVPAERTFSGLGALEAERTDHVEVGVQQQVLPHLAVGFRAFQQQTTNQQVALFGLGALVPTGQYGVATIGDLTAHGWAMELSGAATSRLKGSLSYGVTSTNWLPGTTDALLLVGIAAPPRNKRLHDLTTSVEAELPLTATRVLVTYKMNSGFARRTVDGVAPEVDTRFDLQVVQRLPFLDFTSARWQALFAIRNLFRDSACDASVYDELLVVRPPKRVVTGLLVRF